MYAILPTKKYQKSLKRYIHSGLFDSKEVDIILNILIKGKLLDQKYHNHRLHGEYVDCFECHIKSDVLLIYKIDEKEEVIILVNIGSHSELFE